MTNAVANADQELPYDSTLSDVRHIDRILEDKPFKKLMEKPEFATKVKELDGLVFEIRQHYENLRPEEAQRLIETRIPDILTRLDEDLLINNDSLAERLFSGKHWPYSSGSWSQYLLGHMCNNHEMSRNDETGAIRCYGIRGVLLLDREWHPLLGNEEFEKAALEILRFGADLADRATESGAGPLSRIAEEHGVSKEALDRFKGVMSDWEDEIYKADQERERRGIPDAGYYR